MKNETMGAQRSPQSNPPAPKSHPQVKPQQKPVLTPAQWVRTVLGVETPFGHDHFPTVFE